MTEKICCTKCKIEKEADKENFYWRKDTKSWRRQCRCCVDKRKKKWENDNKDSMSIWRSQWSKRHNKEYYQNNKEKEKLRVKSKPKHLLAKYQATQKLKPKNKIRLNISRSISMYIKKCGGFKNDTHLKYVDWEYNDLIAWLEAHFETWMNWNNYGRYNKNTWNDNDSSTWTWQIDHIIPHSKYKYESMDCDEFRKCWSLSNLRPYSSKQNILDRDRNK